MFWGQVLDPKLVGEQKRPGAHGPGLGSLPQEMA